MAIGGGLMVGSALANTPDARGDGIVHDHLPPTSRLAIASRQRRRITCVT